MSRPVACRQPGLPFSSFPRRSCFSKSAWTEISEAKKWIEESSGDMQLIKRQYQCSYRNCFLTDTSLEEVTLLSCPNIEERSKFTQNGHNIQFGTKMDSTPPSRKLEEENKILATFHAEPHIERHRLKRDTRTKYQISEFPISIRNRLRNISPLPGTQREILRMKSTCMGSINLT